MQKLDKGTEDLKLWPTGRNTSKEHSPPNRIHFLLTCNILQDKPHVTTKLTPKIQTTEIIQTILSDHYRMKSEMKKVNWEIHKYMEINTGWGDKNV